jgi:hypothetical protein
VPPRVIPVTPCTNGRRSDRHVRAILAGVTVDELAEELALHPGDVRVLLAQLDSPVLDGEIPDEFGGEVRDRVDHLCLRTVPEYWWPGTDPNAGKGATKMR